MKNVRFVKSWRHKNEYLFKFTSRLYGKLFYVYNIKTSSCMRYKPRESNGCWHREYVSNKNLTTIDKNIISNIIKPFIETLHNIDTEENTKENYKSFDDKSADIDRGYEALEQGISMSFLGF